MARTLDGLRAPDALAAIDVGGDLRADAAPLPTRRHPVALVPPRARAGGMPRRRHGARQDVASPRLLFCGSARKRTDRRSSSCPASLIANWAAEAQRFTPSLRLLVAHAATTGAAQLATIDPQTIDGADARRHHLWFFVADRVLREREWGAVILDEAQAIKNAGAKQTRVVKSLRARARFALTGTPVENRLADLWSLFDFLSPGLLGTAKAVQPATKNMAAQAARWLCAAPRPHATVTFYAD